MALPTGTHEILGLVRFRRVLTAATLAVLAAAGLSACESKVGLAASANGHTLSHSDLSSYVQTGAQPYTDSNNETIVPKVYALGTWISTQLFADTIARHGGPATAGELSAARTAVLGSNTEADYQKAVAKQGYTDKFADLVLDQSSMLVVLVQRLGKVDATQALSVLQSGQADSALLKAVNDTKPQVEASTRYGEWDPTRLRMSTDPTAGVPDFVIFPASSAPSASPTPAP
jgi:hypothetical protein